MSNPSCSKYGTKTRSGLIGSILALTSILIVVIVLFIVPNVVGVDWTDFTAGLTWVALILFTTGTGTIISVIYRYWKACSMAK